jgi:hypothetical protein
MLKAPTLEARGLLRLEQLTGAVVDGLTDLEQREWNTVRAGLAHSLSCMENPPLMLNDPPNRRACAAGVLLTLAQKTLMDKEISYENMKKVLASSAAKPPSKRWSKWEQVEQDLAGTLFEKRWDDVKLFLDSKTKDFTFRLHSGAVYANKDLFRYGIREMSAFQHCGADEQSITHLWMQCESVAQLMAEMAGDLALESSSWRSVDQRERHYFLKLFHIIYSENLQGMALEKDKILAIFSDWLSLRAAVHERRGQMLKFIDKWQKGLNFNQARTI